MSRLGPDFSLVWGVGEVRELEEILGSEVLFSHLFPLMFRMVFLMYSPFDSPPVPHVLLHIPCIVPIGHILSHIPCPKS
jgi:hypothetical protein